MVVQYISIFNKFSNFIFSEIKSCLYKYPLAFWFNISRIIPIWFISIKNATLNTSIKLRHCNLKKTKTSWIFVNNLNLLKKKLADGNFSVVFSILVIIKKTFKFFVEIYKYTIDSGNIYLRGLIIIFVLDSLVIDDEPLWEPLEWSLVQTWVFFIFIFAWIGENLISSRFGAYSGRDKRIWFSWYKTFWLIELWYLISFGAAILFVIVPFYYEITYNVALVFSWWHWYSKIFFFKFITLYALILILSNFILLNTRWLNWKKIFTLALFINFILGYLLYSHFIISFFGYFTDPIWYQKTKFIDLIQLSHEPLKWGWGPAKRDHFTYHKVTTVFWFKNDSPFAASFLLLQLFIFLSIFFLNFYWLVLLRKIYTTKEVSYTYLTYAISALRQFFYFFLLLYVFIFVSYLATYWRFPLEFLWISNLTPWWGVFFEVIKDYINLLMLIV